MANGLSLKELAEKTDSTLKGDPELRVHNVADLETATAGDVSFYANPRYERALYNTKAGAVFAKESLNKASINFLICKDPSRAFQKALEILRPDALFTTAFNQIHPSAVIHESASIAKNVTISPCATVDANVTIKKGTSIGAGCFIGPHVQVGRGCQIHPNVTVREGTIIGDFVIIQPNVVIGSCGFGFHTDEMGAHTKICHYGNVIIEDEVEIGAGTTIDRARFHSTVIGKGTKIDNLVQIGHNVRIGKHCLIVSQAGIAGSTELGDHVVIGGQTGVTGHIKIGDGVMVASRSGVSKSLKGPGKYGGMHAVPFKDYQIQSVEVRNIKRLSDTVKELKKQIDQLTITDR